MRKSSIIVLGSILLSVLLYTVIFGWPFGGLRTFLFVMEIAALYYAVRQRSIALSFYFAFMLLYYGFVPLIQEYTGIAYFVSHAGLRQLETKTFIFILLNIVSILYGYHFTTRARSDRAHYRRNGANITLCGDVVIIGFIGFIVAIYGAARLFTPRVDQLQITSGYIHLLFATIKFIPVFMVLSAIDRRLSSSRKRYPPIRLWVLIIIALVISNPFNTPRFMALTGILMIVIYYLVRSYKKISAIYLAGLFPFIAILLLPLTSALRHGFSGITFIDVLSKIRGLEFSLFSILQAGFNIEDFTQSNYVISQLLPIIPRFIWPTRASSLGIEVAHTSGWFVYNNIGINSFFSFYADWGFIGVVLGSMAFGFILKKCFLISNLCYFTNRRFLYPLMLTCFVPIIFRGDLSTAMWGIYSSAFAYEICRLMARLRLVASTSSSPLPR